METSVFTVLGEAAAERLTTNIGEARLLPAAACCSDAGDGSRGKREAPRARRVINPTWVSDASLLSCVPVSMKLAD